MNIYKFIWSRIGGRPWTYILRDSWHEWEVFWIIGLLAIGATLGKFFGWFTILSVLGIFLAGYIAGHLFWGTRYIHDQKEED